MCRSIKTLFNFEPPASEEEIRAASLQFVSDAVKNDSGIYPTTEVKAKLFPELATNEDYTRLLTRTWTRFSTGQ